MKPNRSYCVVPFCRNSSAKWSGGEYICGPHWRLLPKDLKRERARLCRILLKSGELVEREGQWFALTDRAVEIGRSTWKSLCEAAKQAATGT